MNGPPPGIDLSETQVPRILGVNIATYVLACVVIVLRFISRWLSRAPLWWDDWLMIPAITFASLICFISITYMLDHGLGKHIWVSPKDAGVVWAKGLFISEISYTGIICSIKFSLLTFYWRIFKQSKIRVPIYFLGTIVGCWGIAVLLITIFQCAPVSGFWDRFSPNPPPNISCGVNVNEFFDGNSIPNIITDAALLVLPIPFVWNLHLPRAQKLALSSTFLLGVFVVGVSIARFTFIINLNLLSPDITWNFVNVQIWTGVESHVGIVCACLPSLRPLLNLVLNGSVDSNNRNNTSGRKGSGRGAAISSRLTNSRKRASSQSEGDGMDGFILLTDNKQVPYAHTEIGPSDPRLVEPRTNNNSIQVRTEVSVINQV